MKKAIYEVPQSELISVNLEAGILGLSGGEEGVANISFAAMTLDDKSTFNGWD